MTASSEEQQHLCDELTSEPVALHRLIVDHGTGFAPSPLPPDVSAGKPNSCFHNAFMLASSEPARFTYYEGFATYRYPTAEEPERSMALAHAWCVANGRVVDPTWVGSRTIEPLAYRGVALPLDLVEPFAAEYSRGPLNHHARDLGVVYAALGLDQPSQSDAG